LRIKYFAEVYNKRALIKWKLGLGFGFWGIDCLFLTQKGRPVAMLRSLDDDSHVRTRVCQYEALKSEKAAHIAKQLVLAKLEGQNEILKKYGLKRHDY
jgi:CRISPR/Cas system-associated endonuclease Cas1